MSTTTSWTLVDRTRGRRKLTKTSSDAHANTVKYTPPPGPSRLLALPAELRIKIYELILSPSVTVVLRSKLNSRHRIKRHDGSSRPGHWRYATEPHTTKSTQVRFCDELPLSQASRDMSAKRNPAGRHPFSLTSILFTNKQIHGEAAAVLYKTSIFFFEPFRLARTFLRNAGQTNLESIRNVTLEHIAQMLGRGPNAQEIKRKAEQGFVNMCRHVVDALPNLKKLIVRIELHERRDTIVPDFSDQGCTTFGKQEYEARFWMRAISMFAELKQLSGVSVRFELGCDEDLELFFMSNPDIMEILPWFAGDPEHDRIQERWLRWHKKLYRSMGEVMEGIILRKPEEELWKDHLAKLNCYTTPEAETVEGAAYKAFVVKRDKEAEDKRQKAAAQAGNTVAR
ncbi:hypothetical protein LTR56_008456 [Elasticomyces elasticus]|nr:hypothetical protein LTR56_008456 [Elasticomyces elasticus]KAK4924210.1 hypothetical protein LTR49_008731 [Elasticomyces elasticus]KAK5746544.1 hypothetical protein LTS12_022672 [Elasticomyces elasticus]